MEVNVPDIKVIRTYHEKSTISKLKAKGLELYTLELPWKNNAQNVSCIPEGTYKYEVKYSSLWRREVIWLYNVKDRSAIQVHVGNFLKDTRGCLLVGMQAGKDSVGNSKVALEALLKVIPRQGLIEISS